MRQTFDFDLIDAHFLYPDGVAATWLGWWFHRPVVITERGTMPQHAKKLLSRRAMSWALDRAAGVIAVAHTLSEGCRALGVRPEKLEVIPNGVDTERFRPRDRAESRRQLGLREEGRLLVSVGHLSPRKGFQRVLRVLPNLLRESSDLTFAVIGGPGAEGNNGPELRRLSAELHLEDRVRLVGPQSPDQVACWLSAADLFVLATDFEGCPNAVLEALASGTPVVVSRVGEVDRMVPEGAGLLVNDPNNLVELEEKIGAALRRPWDRAGIRTAMVDRTWDAVADRVLDYWHRALTPTDQSRLAQEVHE